MKITVTSSRQLSTHFKSLRRAKGWSQADLGQKLGIGQARVAQIEGDPGSISVDRLLQILHLIDAKVVIETQIEPERVGKSLVDQERAVVRGSSIPEERPTQVVGGLLAENHTKRVAGKPVESKRTKQETLRLKETALEKRVQDAVGKYQRLRNLMRAKEPLKAESIKNKLLSDAKSSTTSSKDSPTKKKW